MEPLFHVTTWEHCEKLIDRVYRRDNPPQEADICEICAIAAAGCQINSAQSEATNANKSEYLFHTFSRIPNVLGTHTLQNMRAFIGLSLCMNLERSTTARSLIGTFHAVYFLIY
jgi:hypothetical protein